LKPLGFVAAVLVLIAAIIGLMMVDVVTLGFHNEGCRFQPPMDQRWRSALEVVGPVQLPIGAILLVLLILLTRTLAPRLALAGYAPWLARLPLWAGLTCFLAVTLSVFRFSITCGARTGISDSLRMAESLIGTGSAIVFLICAVAGLLLALSAPER
jgi:hypothetical protein